ncbi:MAG: CopG family transcriptional regulator [Promethearchaeota archaeon]
MKKHTTVSIPKTLAEIIKLRIQGTEFKSPSSYVTYILGEIEKEIEAMEDDKERD